jgi:C-terminal processing protease CtpA/Prc
VKRAIAVLFLIGFLPARAAEFLTPDQRRMDFDAFCQFVSGEYAYFDTKVTDWARACSHYRVEAQKATDRDTYIGVLERALGQLYDSHTHLGTNTNKSPRLIPTQADLMAAWKDGRALITDVRAGSAAEKSGVHVGDEVLSINGMPVAAAVASVEPLFLRSQDGSARDWALRTALAGRHDMGTMRLELRSSAGQRSIAYAPSFPNPDSLLSAEVHEGIGHVRIRNSLGEQSLVREFDAALDRMPDAKALVIDLRETPSGGVSSVARAMIGRLIDSEKPYQRHELVEEFRSTGIRRIWTEYVAPRPVTFRGPVVVLVGAWTGSMGEGLAIGLNASRGAPVLGRPMAHLLGALGQITLPKSQIVVRIPVEKLFHVDGTPREAFVPCPAGDNELAAAFDLAEKLAKMKAEPSLQPAANGCR